MSLVQLDYFANVGSTAVWSGDFVEKHLGECWIFVSPGVADDVTAVGNLVTEFIAV